jgi:hypothetical protein
MKRTVTILVACAAILGGMAVMGQDKKAASDKSTAKKIRIGTYDNRAIPIAWAPSKYNTGIQKMEEMKKAKAEGDTKKVEELKAWGNKHQRQLHRQGFGKVPVDDLLAPVKDQLPEVAKKAGVVAIVWQCDFTDENVEIVDVTHEIVMLYSPNERTLKWIDDLKNVPPMDLEDIEKHQDEM